jgi:CcmD family protein
MNGIGYLIAAYAAAGTLFGLYLLRLRRRERALERNERDGGPR